MKLVVNNASVPTKKPSTPAEYIKAIPIASRAGFKELHQIIIDAAPKALQGMSYGMPCIKLNGILVYYACHKGHYGLYPMADTIIEFKDKLVKYECSKGAIKFNHGSPLPKKLVTDIVKYRVKQHLAKAQ